MGSMKLPAGLKLNQRILSDNQIETGKKLLKEGNSQRFVARKLGVSRHNILMHCVEGYAEKFIQKYKSWEKEKQYRGSRFNERELERYHILAGLFPEKMKARQKRNRIKMGKEYYKKKREEYKNRSLLWEGKNRAEK